MPDVPWHESGPAQARGALRVDLKPQFRGPAGLPGAHAPRVAANGGGSGHRRPVRRYQDMALTCGWAYRASAKPQIAESSRERQPAKTCQRIYFTAHALFGLEG